MTRLQLDLVGGIRELHFLRVRAQLDLYVSFDLVVGSHALLFAWVALANDRNDDRCGWRCSMRKRAADGAFLLLCRSAAATA
jgi:hypothetical protein